jgi:hypothetical protein
MQTFLNFVLSPDCSSRAGNCQKGLKRGRKFNINPLLYPVKGWEINKI